MDIRLLKILEGKLIADKIPHTLDKTVLSINTVPKCFFSQVTELVVILDSELLKNNNSYLNSAEYSLDDLYEIFKAIISNQYYCKKSFWSGKEYCYVNIRGRNICIGNIGIEE